MSVDVRGGELWVDDRRLELNHAVQSAEQLPGGDLLVLYVTAADDYPAWKTFANLVRVDGSGDVRWTAQLPGSHGDVYVSLLSTEPIVAQSFSGYRCTIDARTGGILRREFVK